MERGTAQVDVLRLLENYKGHSQNQEFPSSSSFHKTGMMGHLQKLNDSTFKEKHVFHVSGS